MIYKFTIPVKPVAKQSFRAIAAKKGAIHGFTADHITKNKLTIQKYIKSQLKRPVIPATSWCRINRLHFIFTRPVKMAKELDLMTDLHEPRIPKTTKPDLDNLIKQVLDSIKGILISDDNIVCEFRNVGKYYGKEDCIIIEIEGH